jgi:hypothetical protein
MKTATRKRTNSVWKSGAFLSILCVSTSLAQGPQLPTIPGLEPLSPQEQRASAERDRQRDKLVQAWGPPDGMGGLVSGSEPDFIIHSNSGEPFAKIWNYYAAKCGIKGEFNSEYPSHIGSRSLSNGRITTHGFKNSKIGDNLLSTLFSTYPDDRAVSVSLVQHGKVTYISVTGVSVTGPKRE